MFFSNHPMGQGGQKNKAHTLMEKDMMTLSRPCQYQQRKGHADATFSPKAEGAPSATLCRKGYIPACSHQ